MNLGLMKGLILGATEEDNEVEKKQGRVNRTGKL